MSLTSIVDLSFSIIFGLLATILVLWKVTQFVNAKSPIALVAGPAKDHWLTGLNAACMSNSGFVNGVTGNYDRLFRDGFEYNLNLVQKYGGVVKIFALFGVSAHVACSSTLTQFNAAICSRSSCTYQIHRLCTISL